MFHLSSLEEEQVCTASFAELDVAPCSAVACCCGEHWWGSWVLLQVLAPTRTISHILLCWSLCLRTERPWLATSLWEMSVSLWFCLTAGKGSACGSSPVCRARCQPFALVGSSKTSTGRLQLPFMAWHSTWQQAAVSWAEGRNQPGPSTAAFRILGSMGAFLWVVFPSSLQPVSLVVIRRCKLCSALCRQSSQGDVCPAGAGLPSAEAAIRSDWSTGSKGSYKNRLNAALCILLKALLGDICDFSEAIHYQHISGVHSFMHV